MPWRNPNGFGRGFVYVSFSVGWVSSFAHGGFVRQGGAGEVLTPGQDAFARSHDWYWDGATGASPVTDGTRWTTVITDPDAGVPKEMQALRRLNVSIQHTIDPAGPKFEFGVIDIHQEFAQTTYFQRVNQASHNRGTGRFKDVAGITVVTRPVGSGEPSSRVNTHGAEIPEGLFRFSASVRAGTSELKNIRFSPDYTRQDIDPLTGLVIIDPATGLPKIQYREGGAITPQLNIRPDGSLAPGQRTAVDLSKDPDPPPAGEGWTLSSYIVRSTSSPEVSTHLAFFGTVGGATTELDLDAGALLLAGMEEFLTPQLHSETEPLFVGVDLSEWLTHPAAFAPDQAFSFVNGKAPELPGIMVSRSEISVVPGTGFVASDDPTNPNDGPFTGVATVGAMIDGSLELVPEPAGAIAMGAVAALAMRVRRRSAAQARR